MLENALRKAADLGKKERESLRKMKVLLSRIKAQQGQLSLLERCKLTEEEQSSVQTLKAELQELEKDAKFHIDLLRGDVISR